MSKSNVMTKPDDAKKVEFSFIDLYAGCGGLSLGLMRAGWKALFGIEKSHDAFKTFQHNILGKEKDGDVDWPDWLPQETLSIEVLLNRFKENILEISPRIDLVVGGPPCQGFSMAGMRKSNDPRNRLVHRFLDFVKLTEPIFVLLENVEGIRRPFQKDKKVRKKQAPSDRLERKLKDLNYEYKWITLEAHKFGVAQSRSRSFLVAVSQSLLSDWSEYDPEEYIENSRVNFLKAKNLPVSRSISVKQAISDLQTMTSCGGRKKKKMECVDSPGFNQIKYDGPRTAYQKILRKNIEADKAPNSMRLVNHRKTTLKRFKELLADHNGGEDLSEVLLQKYKVKKHSFSILDPNKPAPTITSIPDDFLHYCEPRVLTVRELARIQSFPDWFDFLGKYTTGGMRRRNEVPRYSQVANAVPPFIAEVIGMALKDFYTDVTSRSS